MRAYVDQDSCVGCGLCTDSCPEVFQLNDDAKAEVIADTTDENRAGVLEAIDGCPVSAIREEE
ncbi:MAG: ferredoxin [Oscillospiraceae bacterium]|nr:ferredoxin [Oscillospiraceae bacterium]